MHQPARRKGVAPGNWQTGDMGGTKTFAGHDHSHGRPFHSIVSEQNVPLERLSMDQYSELVAQKLRFEMSQKELKMMVENLAVVQAWCSREHDAMVRIQAENKALLSQMQDVPEVNVASSQGLCDKLADCIEGDIATLLDDVHRVLSSTGCKTDTPLRLPGGDTGLVDEQWNFKPSSGASQGGSEHSAGSDQSTDSRGWQSETDEEVPDSFQSFFYGDEPQKVPDTAQQLDAEKHFDITLGDAEAAEEAPNSYVNSSHPWGYPQVPNVSQKGPSGVKEPSQVEALTPLNHVFDEEESFQAAEEAPNSYVHSSHPWGCLQVPNVFQSVPGGVKESPQVEALTSLRHAFHDEESFQAHTHQYSWGVGEELYGRAQHSCPAPPAGVSCFPRNAPSSSYGATATSRQHPSYFNHANERSGHSSALGSPSNVHGPCLDHHRFGANMDAQRCSQPTLAWSGAHGPQWSNQQGSSNFGSRFAPNYEQQPAHVRAPEQPKALRARQLRAMAPGTVSIMVRNIPARYNKERLLLEWPVEMHRFNMLYLAANKRGMSLGYAFLNFASSVDALAFQRRWHGHYLSNHGANKHLDISQARVQGLVESLRDILERKDAPVWRNAACVPLVFEDDQLLDINEVLRQHGLVQSDHMRIDTLEDLYETDWSGRS